jgi:hypothetical protein
MHSEVTFYFSQCKRTQRLPHTQETDTIKFLNIFHTCLISVFMKEKKCKMNYKNKYLEVE